MMVEGSTELYAADRDAMDAVLRIAELPTGYRYQLTTDSSYAWHGPTHESRTTNWGREAEVVGVQVKDLDPDHLETFNTKLDQVAGIAGAVRQE